VGGLAESSLLSQPIWLWFSLEGPVRRMLYPLSYGAEYRAFKKGSL
jgi:hypothetical protein